MLPNVTDISIYTTSKWSLAKSMTSRSSVCVVVDDCGRGGGAGNGSLVFTASMLTVLSLIRFGLKSVRICAVECAAVVQAGGSNSNTRSVSWSL